MWMYEPVLEESARRILHGRLVDGSETKVSGLNNTQRCFSTHSAESRVVMNPTAMSTLRSATPLLTAAAATPCGQAALVLFGAAAVIASVGYTAGKIAELIRVRKQKAHQY
ncbi:hypothetical protein FJT64_005093 [Amphibalanus amphitrite]|uniref:Uncharacterized protein n=1 Tax=Amphibalanus amphitrite TaxID=1232801 RepID=A0A6A4VWZ2_AMPAM|nr:hypothetical protein FJT64_005093 [Amphibalanus amphitrite]